MLALDVGCNWTQKKPISIMRKSIFDKHDWRSSTILTTIEDAMQSCRCQRRRRRHRCCKWIQFLFMCAQKSNWIFDLDWHRFSVWVQWNAFICCVCRWNAAALARLATPPPSSQSAQEYLFRSHFQAHQHFSIWFSRFVSKQKNKIPKMNILCSTFFAFASHHCTVMWVMFAVAAASALYLAIPIEMVIEFLPLNKRNPKYLRRKSNPESKLIWMWNLSVRWGRRRKELEIMLNLELMQEWKVD